MKLFIRKTIICLMAFAMVLLLVALPKSVNAGTCGENLTWSISGTTLTISGTGDMDSGGDWNRPWRDYRDLITKIVITDGVTSIDDYAFRDFNVLNSVDIPDTVTKIYSYAFYECSRLTTVKLPSNLNYLGQGSFGKTNINKITIPNNIERCEGQGTAGGGPFSNCDNLKTVEFKNGIKKIPEYLFCECTGLEEITIPDTVTEIGKYAFLLCENLSTIDLGNGLETILDYAFRECIAIKNVSIPDTVTEIKSYAFFECSSLKTVKLSANLSYLGQGSFAKSNIDKITIPNNIEKCDGVGYGGGGPFGDCEKLKTVEFLKGIKKIPENLFYKCTGIEEITIPDTVTEIANNSFGRCTSLNKITIGKNVVKIGNSSFLYSDNLTIYGYSGSYAETYANEKNIPFLSIGSLDKTYKKMENVPVALDENIENIALLDNAKGSIGGNPTISKVFPGDFSVKFPSAKIGIKKETNDDGTYDIKMQIGLKDNLVLNKDADYEKYVDDYNDAKENLNKCENFFNKYNGKSGIFTITEKKPNFKPEIDFIGFYEATISETGSIIKEDGGVIIKAKGDYKYEAQCIIPPFPLPIYYETGIEVEAKGKISLKNLILSGKPEKVQTFTIEPSFFIGGGLGVCELATAGLRGSLGLEMQVSPSSKGGAIADISLPCKMLFVFDNEVSLYKINPYPYPLWPKNNNSFSLLNVQQSNKSILGNNELKYSARDYQEKTTAWTGKQSRLFTKANGNEALTKNTLQEYILPDSIPTVNAVDGEKVMVYQANDANRSNANAAVLNYSVFENESWSEPKAVKDNGTLDTYADSKVIGDDLYVAWQKCNSLVESNDVNEALKEIAKKSEIYVAKYNSSSKSFDYIWRVTENDYLDGIPKLVDCNGKPGIVWMRNTQNNVIDTSGTKQIYSSVYDGSKWSAEEKLCQSVGTIGELVGVYTDNRMVSYYTLCNSDGTQQTFCKSNNGSSKIIETNTDNCISDLKVYSNKINYAKEGSIIELSNTDNTATQIKTVESNVIGSNAKRYSTPLKDAILWMTNDDNGCAFYSSVLEDGEYSIPVEIYRDEKNIGKIFDAVLNEDGSWDIVYTGQSVKDGSKTSLFHVCKKNEEKLILNDVLINEYEMSDGSQPIQYSVTNNGEESIEKINLTISVDSNEVVNKTINCYIMPGETAYFEDEFNSDVSGDIKVQVSSKNQKDLTDTVYEDELQYNNFSVDVEKSVGDDDVTFVATITNDGLESNNGSVSFYRDSNAMDLLETKTFEELDPGESTTVEFTYSTEDAVINTEEACPCSIKVDAGEDFDETNNIWYGITYLWEFSSDVQLDMQDNCHTHELVKTNAKEATCLAAGNTEYWTCSGCHKLFGDECGNGIIELTDTVVEKAEHALTHVAALDATETTDGNYEYWYCSGCNKYYKNAEASQEYSGTSWKIPKTGEDEPEVETFTVKFDLQGYGSSIKDVVVDKGAKLSMPTNPTASGYKFMGWYKEKSCKTAWDFGNDTVTSNMTLYAKWEKESSGGFFSCESSKKVLLTKAPLMMNSLLMSATDQRNLLLASKYVGLV